MVATAFKCDHCGTRLTAEEVSGYKHYMDLCPTCLRAAEIKDLKDQIAQREQWLKDTFLGELERWKVELAELEASPIRTMRGQ